MSDERRVPAVTSSRGGDVDTKNAQRSAWLVKVPKYLSDEWKARAGTVVGEIASSVDEKTGAPRVKFVRTGADEASTSAKEVMTGPAEHAFKLAAAEMAQTVLIATEDLSQRLTDEESGKVALTGKIVKRADIRPLAMDGDYLKMKIESMRKANVPKRQIQQLEFAETKFKPRDAQREKFERKIAKTQHENRSVRAEKQDVINKLFEAFTAHEFYRLYDLQQLTKQPPGYLKEILNDIAVYHTRPPHRAMWQLKPEYRAYKDDQAEK